MRTALACVILHVAAGAAPSPEPAGDYGRIYVYAQRPSAVRSWIPITCGGSLAAELRQGTFFAIAVSPGRHALGAEKGVPVVVDVASGEETFVRLDWSHSVNRPPIPVLRIVRAGQAREEMRYLSYIGARKVLSRSVLRSDPRDPISPRLKRRAEP